MADEKVLFSFLAVKDNAYSIDFQRLNYLVGLLAK
jgi:hypothetical protein